MLSTLCSLPLLIVIYVNLSHQQDQFESIRSEYANAQLECNAADERAKLLASEVIGLEEKVLNFFSILFVLTVKIFDW